MIKMAKIRGKRVYQHPLPVFAEMWALERELDSLSQKGYPVSKQLGRIRSIIQRYPNEVVREQKTLKRWINPAPNHSLEQKKKQVKPDEFAEHRLTKSNLHKFKKTHTIKELLFLA